MTMMALTRRRHRGLHLWALALGLLAVGAIALGFRGSQVSAIAEGDVQFAVTQSPAGGSMVQVGSTVSFGVSATVTTAPVALPVHFEFDYPSGLSFISGSSTPAGVVCTDNTPGLGKVRCSYGLVGTGPRLPITMTFSVLATTTTDPSQAMVVAGDSDGGPDTAADGVDDTFTGAGTLTAFGPGTIGVSGSGSPSTVFERGATTYTATLQNTSGSSTGAFNSAVVFTNGIVTNTSCSSGAAGGIGTANATCTASSLADAETLTVTASVVAADTSSGSDLSATVTAPALGISTAGSGVAIDELGLDSTGGTLAIGTAVNVCTGPVPSDVNDDSAAGQPQPNNGSLLGSSSGNPLLQLLDFQVSGPAAGTLASATGCAANQSGVRFTPSSAGAYTVSALYNTGGTNSLVLNVGGAVSNPVPSASTLAPSSANAGSGQFTMTVAGSNFVPSSVVRWNGSPLATSFVSANQLDATVLAGNIASAGNANVTVFTGAPGGGTSNTLTFTINSAPNPVPAVSSLSPNTIGAGAAQFQLTVTGTNFVAGSVVRWNGSDLATTYGSSTSVTATVPAANVASAGAANVTAFNPAPGGGLSVTPQAFTITAGAAKLAFTTQPGAGVAADALGAQPVVAIQTSANATVTGDNTTSVTLSLNGTGTITCTGGLSKTVSSGVASFAGCEVSQAGSDFTISASAAGLASATSETFDITAAPPVSSTEVTVTNPATGAIPRSRLVFEIATGNLAGTAASFIIKRGSDAKYWNNTSGEWQTELVLNTAIDGEGATWKLAITGEARRDFVNSVVTIEARITVGTAVYYNATIPTLTIR